MENPFDSNEHGKQAIRVIGILEDAGLEAWLVGGCVRDALLGRPVHDFDIACNALWSETQAVLEASGIHTVETGIAHGTLTAISKGTPLEITTYRIDGAYTDGRHPDSVQFTRSIQEDLARRDFTINAMAWHPTRGLLDPFNGQADLRTQTLRAVGEPEKRFMEDALRILRGIRFASQLGFAIDQETASGMRAQASKLDLIAAERIAHELEGLLCGKHVHGALMAYADVIGRVIPEITPMIGFDQKTKYHIYDVWEHTAYAVQYATPEPLTRWATLFHDIGKPSTFTIDEEGVGHFYGHAHEGIPLAKRAMKRLKMSPAFIERVAMLVRYHDCPTIPEPKYVKRLLRKLDGDPDLLRALCSVKRADSLSHAPAYRSGVAHAQAIEDCLDLILRESQPFTVAALNISGKNLLAMGMPQGPHIGAALNAMLEAVMDETLPNERAALLRFAREWWSKHETEIKQA